jgi:T4 RnlA family RNA ligase
MFQKDYITMWEYVSFKNKIVLNYNKSNLILLKVRDNKTGEYIDVENFRGYGFDVVENKTNVFENLDSILLWSETAINIEGCVVTFENNLMIKMKTKWYFDLHHLIDSINREDYIIKMILNKNIDDAISNLDSVLDFELIQWIKEIEQKIFKYIKFKKNEILLLVNEFDNSMKDFAIKNKYNKNFSLALSVLKGKDIYDIINEYIFRETNKLGKAKKFLNNINQKNKLC